MSGKNKKHNSIIFLTTLSVYLSLSLLGAAPQVLAYAATTRDFDIRTEIEYQDDLDNKPDEESLEKQAEDFPKIFADLLTEISRNLSEQTFKSPLSANFQAQGFGKQFFVFGNESNVTNGISESINPLDQICDRYIFAKVLPAARSLTEYKNLYNSGTHIGQIKEVQSKIKADASGLFFEVSFSRSNTEVFADYLNARYASLAKNTEETRLKKFYENTKINSENNQVFIVTRLPRAAIDSSIQ